LVDEYRIRITNENEESIEIGMKKPISNSGLYKAFLKDWNGFFTVPPNDSQVEKRPFSNGSIISDSTLQGRTVDLTFGVIKESSPLGDETIELSSEVATVFRGKMKLEIFYGERYRWFYCYLSSDGMDVDLIGKYENFKGILCSCTLVSEDSYKRGAIQTIEVSSIKSTSGGLMFPLFDSTAIDKTPTLKFTDSGDFVVNINGNDNEIEPTITTFSADGINFIEYYVNSERKLYMTFSEPVNRIVVDVSDTTIYLEPTEAKIVYISGDFFTLEKGATVFKINTGIANPSTSTISFAEGWL